MNLSMIRLSLAVLIILSMISMISYATPVTVTSTNLQAKYGILDYVYFLTSSALGSSTPSTNTALSPSGSTGSYTVNRGSSAYMWSPAFAAADSISAGNWLLDLWVSGSSSGTMTVSIYTTTSAGSISSTIISGRSTNTIGTTKAQVATLFSAAPAGNIPANGYILVKLTAPTGAGNPSSFVLYWGSGQPTDFQVPKRVLS